MAVRWALAALLACVVPVLGLHACSSEEDRPPPKPIVGKGFDAALSCSELRDAARQDALSPDGADPECAVDGIECVLEGDAGGCADGEQAVAECFAQRWQLGCVGVPSDAAATP